MPNKNGWTFFFFSLPTFLIQKFQTQQQRTQRHAAVDCRLPSLPSLPSLSWLLTYFLKGTTWPFWQQQQQQQQRNSCEFWFFSSNKKERQIFKISKKGR
jgi:hypothetical protein